LSYNLGVLLQREHRLKEAEARYRTAGDTLNRQANALDAAAQAQSASDPAEAARLRKISARLRENQAEAENALGTVLEGQRKSGAEDAYKQAFNLAPGLLEARHNLAMLYTAQGRDDAAVPLWTANLALNPSHAPSLFHLAGLYRRQGDWANALSLYTRLLVIDPRHVEAAEGRGLALAGMKRTPEALDQLQQAERMRADLGGIPSPDVYETLGDLYVQTHSPNDACAAYRNARTAGKSLPRKAKSDLKRKLQAACRPN